MNFRRRLLLAAGLAVPLRVVAQNPSAPRRVAWFGAGRAGAPSPFLDALRAGLREKGWEEGRNLDLAVYPSDGPVQEAELLARKVVASNAEIIVVYGRDVLTLHRAKPTQPVVFGFSGNPVDAGVVQSFSHPGANFTGISFMSLDLVGKRIEILREIVPQFRRLAVLARPEHAGEQRERAASEAVAAKLGIPMAYIPFQEANGIDSALQAVARAKCEAMVVFPDGVMLAHSPHIAKFAQEARLATMSGWDRFADSGFLATYGPNLRDSYRRLGQYVDRILRGAKPIDIPVELPQTVEMVVNLRTARTLGLKIPQSAMLRADRVIE